MKNTSSALFLDRDGVVNREVGYLHKPEEVEFLPGIFDLCRAAQMLRYKLIIITNQAGIARGLYSEADFHRLMRWMIERFLREQIQLDGYYFCPHHPESEINQYRKDCMDRKPQPGMILRAAAEHKIRLSESIFVGDRCSDLQAGAAAHVGQLVLMAGLESGGCDVDASYIQVTAPSEVIDLLHDWPVPSPGADRST